MSHITGDFFYADSQWKWLTLLHKHRELSHLPRAMKIVFAPKAVTLHWPVLPGRWRSVDSYKSLHCKESDCFARLTLNIVARFGRSANLPVLNISEDTYLANILGSQEYVFDLVFLVELCLGGGGAPIFKVHPTFFCPLPNGDDLIWGSAERNVL